MTGTPLAGGSYVLDPGELRFQVAGGWREAPVAGHDHGARALGQRLVQMDGGVSDWRSYPGAETVLYVLAGSGTLEIGERYLELKPGTGAFAAPGEGFRLRHAGGEPLRLTLTVCPDTGPQPGMGTPFDEDRPIRTVAAIDQERHATGDRFYQLLVDSRVGCRNTTQFIGGIPRSKAPEHYHEYEEAITILQGEGFMHTEDLSAPVVPGSMIFLARGQRHSLECTSEAGMRLVGIFHPSGSPAVSYE